MYPSKPYHTEDTVTALVAQYAPLVKRIATTVARRCPPSIELDDLIQAGIIGLIQAQQDYKADAGTSFITYATMKIHYAIYDDMRKSSGITRDIAQYIKKITAVIHDIEQNTERVSHDKIVEKLGVSHDQYRTMTQAIDAHKAVSIETATIPVLSAEDTSTSPFHLAVKDEMQRKLKSFTQQLPKREQFILALYYNECLPFKAIADILNLTEARVSQIHDALMKKLKRRMSELAESVV